MYYLSLVKLNRLRFKYGMKVRLNSCGKGLCIVHLGSIITNGDVGEDDGGVGEDRGDDDGP